MFEQVLLVAYSSNELSMKLNIYLSGFNMMTFGMAAQVSGVNAYG